MRPLLAVLARFAAREPWRLGAGFLLLALTLAAGLGLLAASGWLIAGAGLAGLGLLAFDTFRPSAAVRGFAVGRTATRYLERLVGHDATLRVLSGLRVDVFRGLAAAPDRLGATGADRLARLSGDLDALDGAHLRFAAPLAAAALTLAALAVALAVVDPRLALAVVGPALVLGAAVPLVLAVRGRSDARLRHHGADAVRRRLVDLDRGRAELAVAGRLDHAAAAVADAADRVAAAETRQHRRDALVRFAAGLATPAAIVGALLVGADLMAQGTISGPFLALLVVAAFALGEAVQPLRALTADLGRMLVAARRVAPLMRGGAGASVLAPAETPPAGLVLALADAAPAADDGRAPRLAPVRLTLRPGERVALVGPSGAGKSTLLALAAGLEPAAAGSVARVPGTLLLTQRTELFAGPLSDILRLGRPDASDETLHAALRTAGLDAVVEARGGLGLRLGEGGSGLSGGERRRLALARLLVADPALVLLDEPTDGLDAATAAAVMAAAVRATAGRAVLLSTHVREEAALCDRLVRLDAGRVVADVPRTDPAFAAVLSTMRSRTDG